MHELEEQTMRAEKRIHELETSLAAAQRVKIPPRSHQHILGSHHALVPLPILFNVIPVPRPGYCLQLRKDEAERAMQQKSSATDAQSDGVSKEARLATLEATLTEKILTNRRLEHKLQELGINPGG